MVNKPVKLYEEIWYWVLNTDNIGTLIIKIGPEIRKLCHILSIFKLIIRNKRPYEIASSQKRMRVGPIADEKVRLFLCYQYAGNKIDKIRLKNRMRMLARFAAFHETLIAHWQYDELKIPI